MAHVDRTDSFIASLGLEAYRVGGSVRDELIGRKPHDADYMVREVDLQGLREHLLLGGHSDHEVGDTLTPLKLRDERQVGWRFARKGLGCIEIALPRHEVSTGPGRHDFEIVVDPALPLEQDCTRRDFTFNALYKAIDGQNVRVYDPTNKGLYDLQHNLIRTTHEDSFRDDPLRTLRALRFVSTLNFDVTHETIDQMRAHADAVTGLTQKGVSGTVLDELSKLLMGDKPHRALRLARDTGVLAVLLPELAPMLDFDQASKYHDLTTDEHTFKALETAAHVDAPLRVRLALLFHDSGKPAVAWTGDDGRKHYYALSPVDAVRLGAGPGSLEDHEVAGARLWRQAAKRLNVPKALASDVNQLCLHHMVTVDGRVKGTKVRRMRIQHGDSLLRDLFLMRSCDLSAKGAKVATNHIRHIAALEQARQEAVADGAPASVGDLKIDGNDLKALGFQGREIGDTLRALLDEAACQTHLNHRDWLIERAQTLASQDTQQKGESP